MVIIPYLLPGNLCPGAASLNYTECKFSRINHLSWIFNRDLCSIHGFSMFTVHFFSWFLNCPYFMQNLSNGLKSQMSSLCSSQNSCHVHINLAANLEFKRIWQGVIMQTHTNYLPLLGAVSIVSSATATDIRLLDLTMFQLWHVQP